MLVTRNTKNLQTFFIKWVSKKGFPVPVAYAQKAVNIWKGGNSLNIPRSELLKMITLETELVFSTVMKLKV